MGPGENFYWQESKQQKTTRIELAFVSLNQ
jgi:hypothetical protein